MKKLIKKLEVFVLGERATGEPINLDTDFKPALWTTYPPSLVKPSQNDWMESLKVSSRVPKYTSTGSVIL